MPIVLSSPTGATIDQTARDFITRALRALNILGVGDTADADQLNDGLLTLNAFIDDLGTQRQTIAHLLRAAYPLSAGVQSYTIGGGGTWNQTRPVTIDGVSVVPDRTASRPIELDLGRMLTVKEWQQIPDKSATSLYPDRAFFDGNWVAGLATIFVYPIPTSSLCDLVLYSPQALAEFPDTETAFTFAPGIARMIRYNLILELAADYEKEPSPTIVRIARESLANVKRSNFQPKVAQFDPALGGVAQSTCGFNIYTDQD